MADGDRDRSKWTPGRASCRPLSLLGTVELAELEELRSLVVQAVSVLEDSVSDCAQLMACCWLSPTDRSEKESDVGWDEMRETDEAA